MSDFLVLGARGNVGRELSTLLTSAGHTVRRATSQATPGAGEVALDLRTGAGLDEALAGVAGAFLLSPPGYVNQDELLGRVVEAAVKHRVPKLVMMTAMGADADPSSPLRRAELHLEQSGLAWNVIRPNWFMQNFHTFWRHGIVHAGAIQLPTGDASASFIDARDIAAVAAALLQHDAHNNRAFDLTGAESLTHAAVAELLTQELGRHIRYDDITRDVMRGQLTAAGLPPDYAENLLVILHFLKLGYAARVTDAVETITGHAPRRFVAYVRDYRAAFDAVPA